MQAHRKFCGAAIVAMLCALPCLSPADILVCRGARGAITYTNGSCEQNAQVRVLNRDAGPSLADEPPHAVVRETGWARPIRVSNRRPDVLAIRAAKLHLQRMDAARRQRAASPPAAGATRLAEYRE